MAFMRFSHFEDMEYLHRQINRVFAEAQFTQKDNSITWTPTIGLLDDSDNLILRMELPGVDSENIDVEITRETVTVSGKRQQQDDSANCLCSELSYDNFRRHISLPAPIIREQAKVNFAWGVLTLILPKIEEAKNRVVKISLDNCIGSDNITSPPRRSSKEAKPPEGALT